MAKILLLDFSEALYDDLQSVCRLKGISLKEFLVRCVKLGLLVVKYETDAEQGLFLLEGEQERKYVF